MNYIKAECLVLIFFIILHSAVSQDIDSLNTRFNIHTNFTETMITLQWNPIAGADAYNVFADYGNGYLLANYRPILTRTQFSFLWVGSGSNKKKVVKGNRVRLYVVPLQQKINGHDTVYTELSCRSMTICNDYLRCYDSVQTVSRCQTILQKHQVSRRIIDNSYNIGADKFLQIFPVAALTLKEIYYSHIDPKIEGACVPFSILVARYLTALGIPCLRASGEFIGQFHNFNILLIDNVEYVLDFTADQFIPESVPVLIPRDYCAIGSCGLTTLITDSSATPIYRFDRIFTVDHLRFSDTPEAQKYQKILDSLLIKLNVKFYRSAKAASY